MADFHIREAQADEISQLAEIERSAAKLFPVGRLPNPETSQPVAKLEAAQLSKLLWVAETKQGLVGFASCQIIGQNLHLEEISVHADFGRAGIGAALLSKVIAAAKTRSLNAVSLTSFLDFAWNAAFYRKHGFRDLPKHSAPHYLQERLNTEAAMGMESRVAMLYLVQGSTA